VENVKGNKYFAQNSDWKPFREEATTKNICVIEKITRKYITKLNTVEMQTGFV
jgi:hypothetical protein